jgi:hypothetical protein
MTKRNSDTTGPSRADTRGTVLSFKVSAKEALRIRRAAKKAGLGVTIYIREATLAEVAWAEHTPRAA